jgi:hypothetical protein
MKRNNSCAQHYQTWHAHRYVCCREGWKEVLSMQQDYVKRTQYQKLPMAHKNSRKKYARKAGKTSVNPCASLHQDMNWPTNNSEEKVNTETGSI